MGIQFKDLIRLAEQAMQDHDFLTEFSPEVQKEVNQISLPTTYNLKDVQDLRKNLWFSIDNEETKDIDQLTYAKQINDNLFKIYIAVAEVEHLVKHDFPIDEHAQHNTTSVYTPVQIFTMLPEKLSYDLTSLVENQDRRALIVEIDV